MTQEIGGKGNRYFQINDLQTEADHGPVSPEVYSAHQGKGDQHSSQDTQQDLSEIRNLLLRQSTQWAENTTAWRQAGETNPTSFSSMVVQMMN